MWIPVFEPGTKWLLFKYHPERQLIEIQRRGNKHVIDLEELAKDAKQAQERQGDGANRTALSQNDASREPASNT